MDDELIEHVLHLIDAKKGDNGRLSYILSMLQEDRPLYISDRKYLESLISMYAEPSKRKVVQQQSVEELKTELTQVKQRLERYEKRGYKKAIGRKSVFFFVTFFFGWHAIIQLLAGTDLINNQNINPYLLPIYQLKLVIPSQVTTIMGQYGLSLEQIVVFAWSLMMLTWIILGFVYLVKFMRSRYNPALQQT
ncbi:hypothetical protein DYY67_1129 [Candidatus Nitrosotalea sp. TS]|uniref:hypothetical protein n=1 Tax=Candidatus Nitrosotalea sp. TS TaxID=2341020 RepID=UPI001407AAC4|nr:hypothetical protein [Candidatus Nitrosotalea sp. TS]NHI04271.1 hypothetical protein [Candidatus Nitrosotalea sp. TS]